MTEQTTDARINGDGTVSPGTYGTITLNGAGTVTGDVTCRELKINGAGKCQGAVKAESVIVNGAGTFEGPVQANEFTVNGSATVRSGVGAGRLRIMGSCALDGGLAAHEVELRGDLRVGGDLESDTLIGEGRFTVDGMLNAGTIDLRLHGRSAATEIGCERMVLRVPEGITAIFSAFADRRLTADSIEGDDLQLIGVHAKVVRGGVVTAGEGCRIDLVEYTESFTRLASAEIAEERRIQK